MGLTTIPASYSLLNAPAKSRRFAHKQGADGNRAQKPIARQLGRLGYKFVALQRLAHVDLDRPGNDVFVIRKKHQPIKRV